MAQFETWLKSDLKKPLEVVKLKGNLFSADNGGNLIGVEVLDDGSPATLSGEVHGYAIREDNYTVFIEGTLANNKASIVLPLACYNVVGQISIVIKVGETTVGACTGYVYRSTTDAVVDPAHVIPSIEELLAQIDACIEATEDANEAAEKIDNMTVAATGLAYDANPTATISEVSGHKHIAFGIPAGTPATIKTQTDYYQNSSSGTVIPSGEWSTTQPTTPQGSFLWVKHHVVWYDDTETDVYSVSRQGVDGSGSVSSILLGSNQLSPDASGQITLPIDNAPTANSGNLVLSGALQSQFSAVNGLIGTVPSGTDLQSEVTALNNKITSRAFNVYASINGSGTVVNRLETGWDTLWTNAKTATGTDSGIIALSGTIDFPANGNNAALGTYYYHGDINLSNKAGIIYLNQYHNDAPFYVVLRHPDGTYNDDQMIRKSDFTNSEVKSQLTPATGITINSVLKQEIGKLVTVYMYITTSSAITALTEIFSGLPTPTSTQNYVSTFLAHDAASSADTYRMSIRDGGKVQNLDALPNGKVIRATFSYFKN